MLLSKYKQWFWEDKEYRQFMEQFIESTNVDWIEALRELEGVIRFRVEEGLYPERFSFDDDIKDYLTHLIIAMTWFVNRLEKRF